MEAGKHVKSFDECWRFNKNEFRKNWNLARNFTLWVELTNIEEVSERNGKKTDIDSEMHEIYTMVRMETNNQSIS